MKRIVNDMKNEIRDMGGIQGWKSAYSISARIGKHYCPYCNNLLSLTRKKQIVNSESEEAKGFNYTSMFEGGSLYGNIEFSWDAFHCDSCDMEVSVKDMRRYERELRKTGVCTDFDAIREADEKTIKKPNILKICLVFTACLLICLIVAHFSSCISIS